MSQLDDNATVVTVLEGSNFDVNVGESAKLQVNEAINYIKSGQAEIAETVGDITTAFNENAVEKTNQFNTNATNKTTAFNNNYIEKKALIDAEVQTAETAATNASNYSAEAKRWAIGDPSEPAGYSAKYWAEEAEASIEGMSNATITIKQNGVEVDSFTLNQANNEIIDIATPTKVSDLSNDSGFITSSALTGYATETYVDNGLNTKQNTLVSGTNIKTINNETILGSGNINIQSSIVAYGTSSTAGNVAEKEVLIPEITELKARQILYIKPSASATVANLTIKLNNFTAYPIRYNNSAITTTTDDLVWNQNFVSQFVFDGEYWQFAGRGYDSNTTYTQNILFDRGNFVSGSGTYAITRYSLCLQKPDMTFEKVTNTEENFSLATDKTVNTHGFLLNGEMLYYSNTAVLANGASSSANTMYRQNSGFDIRYSANTTGTGYTTGDYIYLVGTIGVDGLFYLDSTQWWTNTLPSTNDGKIYVKVGKYITGVSVSLELEHPAYYHDGTKIRVYQSAGNKQDTLVSGTNIKTINNQSLLGSGNITIGGGGGGGAVDSVNGYTGVVVLTASDVGALATSDITEYTAAEVETLWGSI